jgi:hypothetical protein
LIFPDPRLEFSQPNSALDQKWHKLAGPQARHSEQGTDRLASADFRQSVGGSEAARVGVAAASERPGAEEAFWVRLFLRASRQRIVSAAWAPLFRKEELDFVSVAKRLRTVLNCSRRFIQLERQKLADRLNPIPGRSRQRIQASGIGF